MVDVHGHVSPGFEGVRDAFAANFEMEPDAFNQMLGVDVCEVGSAVSVFRRGEKVVDLWAGVADRRTGRPYTSDTLQLVFSASKGITAIAANLLVERGLLDLNAPVADYWPEFGKAGKDDIIVRWLLTHRAGLPWVDGEMTIAEAMSWTPVIDALATQLPAWEPGTQHGYHATTFGWLVGELIRRVTGRSVGAFIQDELSVPLGLDLWIGLPDELHDRVSPLEVVALPTDPALAPLFEQFLGPESSLGRALYAPGGAWRGLDFASFNLPEVWRGEVPAANAITDARSLAKLYAACVSEVEAADGSRTRLFSEAHVDEMGRPQTDGVDHVVLGLDIQYGLGFHVPGPVLRLGGPGSFGHHGAGGSVGFADPDEELGFAYVMNRMFLGVTGDPRSTALIDATYAALA
jgi:CubicO group peptidase (beta-lactamase class C family)